MVGWLAAAEIVGRMVGRCRWLAAVLMVGWRRGVGFAVVGAICMKVGVWVGSGWIYFGHDF